MTQEHSSKLSFSIEESVWLNKGQEIDEVLSMSLDPDITVEERNEHVIIKGGLQLVGEYVLAEENTISNEQSLKEQVTFRSIDELASVERQTSNIKKYFPIDVTIPLNRINNLEDVYVQVESFDYDLPDKSCIQVTADISISGMNANNQVAQEKTVDPIHLFEEEQIDESTRSNQEDEVETFTFEARKEPEETTTSPKVLAFTEIQKKEERDASNPTEEATAEEVEEKREIPLEAKAEKDADEDRTNESKNRDVIEAKEVEITEVNESSEIVNERAPEVEFFSDRTAPELEEETVLEAIEPEEATVLEETTEERVEPVQETQINLAPLTKVVELEVSNEAENTEEEKEEKKRARTDENTLYLTKMLTNGEEQFSKLKMCIIQENESLDTIAERYQISTSQLLRVNRLDSDRVTEGQILYIPVGSPS